MTADNTDGEKLAVQEEIVLGQLEVIAKPKAHTFSFKETEMYLDDKLFVMRSGEMHPGRIPHQYWLHRIQMAKAMGMNTINLYVFWN